MITAAALRAAGKVLRARHREIERVRHLYHWRHHARPEQLPPGEPGAAKARKDWAYWIVQAGRGWGKTRTGAETVRAQVAAGRRRSIALVAPTLGDGRKLMIEGPTGILAVSPPSECPRWVEKDRELRWPNGAIGYLYTSEEPERLRGGNHDFAWCDEMGSWRNAKTSWSNLRFACRITGPHGDHPQFVLTLTPRPTPLIRQLLANPAAEITRGTTYDNRENLDPEFFSALQKEYEGSRLGDQEIKGELLGDTPGALWKMDTIERNRVQIAPADFLKFVVAIDPATADLEDRKIAEQGERFLSETGIICGGIAACRCRGQVEQHGFITHDLSGYHTPEEWGSLAVEAYNAQQADRIVAEVNQGGALVASNIRAQGGQRIPIHQVHASRGKQTRAEPVATLDEKGLIHHVGVHPALEDQMTTWNPLLAKKSPDRMDARVWLITDLMLAPGTHPYSHSAFKPRSVPRRI